MFKPNEGKRLPIDVDGATYLRLPIPTGLVTEKDDIFELIERHVKPHLQAGDVIFVSEKVLALTQGQLIHLKDIKTTPLARLLARNVKNHFGTEKFGGFGHGTSMAMQLIINEIGRPRVLFAAAVAAVTRPIGIHGAFYILCGKRAKSIDCPMSFVIQPYNMYAKLPPIDPKGAARRICERFGHDTVIVDANYRGVYSLGRSSANVAEDFVKKVFRDNPLGQSDEMTPLCIVRRG
ncbi:MAG: coenzyme F420-0:L-glutamate ligase [Patescibacteria group bacterium]|nr:coenzyme F420-0:L-glutamate ligase [Patescibacteria group bacterium]MDE2116528.1 coenzyme F420-0:L-glutamate ligase [Patescibacteria group bacterium]